VSASTCSKKVVKGLDFLIRDILKITLPQPVQFLSSTWLTFSCVGPCHACQHRCVSRQ